METKVRIMPVMGASVRIKPEVAKNYSDWYTHKAEIGKVIAIDAQNANWGFPIRISWPDKSESSASMENIIIINEDWDD